MKSAKFLKVCSILMIVFGVLSLIGSVLAVAGASAVAVLTSGTEGKEIGTILLIVTILILIAAVIQFIAGVAGVSASNNPSRAGRCLVWGGLVIAVNLLGIALGRAAGNEIKISNVVMNLIIPVTYLVSAYQLKKNSEMSL